MNEQVSIRPAVFSDMHVVHQLIRELAIYEHAEKEVITTVAQLQQDGFGESPLFQCLVAEHNHEGVIGFVLFYSRYSTWKGPTIYLEDFLVREQYRRLGVGEKLFNALKEVVTKSGVKRFEWQVLDWNKPAIEFYKKHKAVFESDWLNVKLEY
jgi:GNAT superfamily N-acetyltransferase